MALDQLDSIINAFHQLFSPKLKENDSMIGRPFAATAPVGPTFSECMTMATAASKSSNKEIAELAQVMLYVLKIVDPANTIKATLSQ